ncbi:MAG: exodeoxyribonuclease VII large subunit [Oscillospiraceae bacterium]|jgi:exodeoxyribonuclease VII large subunit|nr:exodeoxyribonuclease VII large subunit [Oscillospiraceae bacterium]
MQSPILSITQLNAYVRAVLEGDSALAGGVYLRGEISGFKRYGGNGHCYFTLKDGAAQVSAVLFANAVQRLQFSPLEGLRVLARGRVSLYESRGQYQVILDDLQPDGVGALYQQLENLKAHLAADGLFASERKRAIPAYPRKIAVVTSSEGAVLHDILQILSRRWPMTEVLLYPTPVQGFGAGEQIAAALLRASADSFADVIIVGRGGGSAEDLWAFNEECVVRAVTACAVPVVSAVGHETDYTLCDMAADLRAPTPSAAAELCTPDCEDEAERLYSLRLHLKTICERHFAEETEILDRLRGELKAYHPANTLRLAEDKLDALRQNITRAVQRSLDSRAEKLTNIAGRLDALSPLKTLARGYAVVGKGGATCSRGAGIKPGDEITVRMADAIMECNVRQIKPINKAK